MTFEDIVERLEAIGRMDRGQGAAREALQLDIEIHIRREADKARVVQSEAKVA